MEGSLGTGGSSCLQKQSHRSCSRALTVMRVFRSLALCWQQPMAIHQLRSPEQVPALPRRVVSRQSSAVVPNSPLSPPKESSGGSTPVSGAFLAASGSSILGVHSASPAGDGPPLQELGPAGRIAGRAQPSRQDIQPASHWVAVCWAVWHDTAVSHGWLQLGHAPGQGVLCNTALGTHLLPDLGSTGLALGTGMPAALPLCWGCPAPCWSHGSPRATNMSPQLESKAGKGIAERALPDWKVALKREREEHQHLLAESYSAVMDLTKQLQISEKNWNQEKVELLARFKEEQQQAEQQAKDLQNKINQVWCPPHRERVLQPLPLAPHACPKRVCMRAPRTSGKCFCLPRGAYVAHVE